MNTYRRIDRRNLYESFAADWQECTHFGIIASFVERTNDVPKHLAKLGVEYLIDFLLINEKTNAFIYCADMGRKNLTNIVEIYYDLRPRTVEWRRSGAQLALRLDGDLSNGFYYENVIITKFVVAYLQTALEEVLYYN
ncbi:hypothetical protein J4G08_08970 [Candidatus Poribacteria bacterium]|nr:hypothetical protein [Candidatus Poribacteria bacterium]